MKRREAMLQSLRISGLVVSAPVLAGLLKGCQGESAAEDSGTMTKGEFSALSRLSDVLLPSGSSIGALDVKVPEMVQVLIGTCFEKEQAKSMLAVLGKLNSATIDGNKIESVEQSAFGGSSNGEWASYRDVKRLILAAYFTSESVMREMLDYHPIAGKHEPCIDLKPDMKLFVDNNNHFV